MSTAPSLDSRRELAHRLSGGIEVTLYWCERDGTTSVELWHAASEERLVFEVAHEHALEAFYHPFAHLPRTFDEPSPALEVEAAR
jgi:hypothetical protein